MFHKFYDALYLQLCNSLTAILSTHSNPVKCFAAAMQEIQTILALLRDKVLSLPFPSEDMEALYFKTVKPRFYALQIFHFEMYGLDMHKPSTTKELLIDWYKNELDIVQRFFLLHAGLYEYYKTGRTEMDKWYFIRGAEVPCIWIPEIPNFDPLYSTQMDYLFAKFIAYERLQEEILKRIGLLDGSLVADNIRLPDPGIKWTGKIVNLGELIYGLYYTGQLNNGNAQLSEIVALFERMFKVKIRDVHHTFGEIRERKVSSPSKFIDSMGFAIQQRVEEDLKYKPR
ncbi:MAG: RteC domain-containing protein [Bacteroidota bacterium]